MGTPPNAPAGVTIRSAEDADWPAMRLLAANNFGSLRPDEVNDMWRAMMPPDSVVVACAGADLVGMAFYLDLRLTVPGGAVLPAAGVSWVCVAPTHRRRGVLTAIFTELHHRMTRAGYPVAALLASEAGIYGRFGYGPATVDVACTIDRREARFHNDVPDPGGVRLVRPADHRETIEALYDRWRLQTPGGLHTPQVLWDEAFADREASRGGGSALFALLHHDGFAMYRIRRDGEQKAVDVTSFVACGSDAHIALWRTLLGLDLMATVNISTYPGDALPYLLTDPRLVRITGTEDAGWLRLIEIPMMLRARRYADTDLSVVLEVTDGVLGGGGRYLLEVHGGRARCEPTTRKPDICTDLSVLGSLYLGAHHARAFAAAGRLTAVDAGLISRLDAAFASDIPAQLGYGF